jgi:hypothetical protein
MREQQVLSPFVAERQALEEMLEAGRPFVDLEPLIDQAPFDDEERAALWLATWARASRCGSTPNVQTRGRS